VASGENDLYRIKEGPTMSFRMRKIFYHFFIAYIILINTSLSISFNLSGDWKELSDQSNDNYNKSGWNTYEIESPSFIKIKFLQDGVFSFAWKVNNSKSSRLYFNNVLLENTEQFWELGNINVKENDTFKWIFSSNDIKDGIFWIAIPTENDEDQVRYQNINLTNQITQGFEESGDIIEINPKQSIQSAIDLMPGGGQILLNKGIYRGSFSIYKPIKLSSNYENGAIIDLDDDPIKIVADNVTISNVSIRNAETAIIISDSSQLIIANNYISNSSIGIKAYKVSNLVLNNNLIDTRLNSLVLTDSDCCQIKNNTFLNNKRDSIILVKNNTRNIILDNNFVYSKGCDIYEIDYIENEYPVSRNRLSGCVKCPGQSNSGCYCCDI